MREIKLEQLITQLREAGIKYSQVFLNTPDLLLVLDALDECLVALKEIEAPRPNIEIPDFDDMDEAEKWMSASMVRRKIARAVLAKHFPKDVREGE